VLALPAIISRKTSQLIIFGPGPAAQRPDRQKCGAGNGPASFNSATKKVESCPALDLSRLQGGMGTAAPRIYTFVSLGSIQSRTPTQWAAALRKPWIRSL